MKKLVIFVLGVAVGFVVAHKISKTPQGRDVFGAIEAKKREFLRAFCQGYRDRETELRTTSAGDVS